jgi:hypothetical protein
MLLLASNESKANNIPPYSNEIYSAQYKPKCVEIIQIFVINLINARFGVIIRGC